MENTLPTAQFSRSQSHLWCPIWVSETLTVGVYLTDLTMVDETNKDFVDDKVNFQKCIQLADIIMSIKNFQRNPYNLTPLENVQAFVQLIPDMVLEENDCYELSLKHEPRE